MHASGGTRARGRMRAAAQRSASAWARLLRERPLLTNGVQGATLGSLADVLAQRMEECADVDAGRTARAAGIGALYSGVVVPSLYRRLDAIWPGTAARAVLCKSVADVCVMGVGGNAVSILLRGTSAAETRELMPGVLLNECRVWLPYNLLAFRVVPLHLRPTTTACLTFCWLTYISHTAAAARRAAGGGGALGSGARRAEGEALRAPSG